MTGLPILRLPSFAKINWSLAILGRRRDGYHEVRTLYQTVDLADELSFSLTRAPGVELTVEGREAPTGEENLVVAAARLLEAETKPAAGAAITLFKRIPLGAGLGGGSSNAALTLMALNRLWQCRLPSQSLSRLAARLGSDVPFFLDGGTALGWGRGERIRRLPDLLESRRIVVFYPGLPISTREAYGAGEWECCTAPSELTEEEAETTIQRLREASRGTMASWPFLDNDFEEVLWRAYPFLGEARRDLLEAGADRVLLSGSGSALVGLGGENPEAIAQRLRACGRGEVYVCRILSGAEYRRRVKDRCLN